MWLVRRRDEKCFGDRVVPEGGWRTFQRNLYLGQEVTEGFSLLYIYIYIYIR
jgi:hypothetical protein